MPCQPCRSYEGKHEYETMLKKSKQQHLNETATSYLLFLFFYKPSMTISLKYDHIVDLLKRVIKPQVKF